MGKPEAKGIYFSWPFLLVFYEMRLIHVKPLLASEKYLIVNSINKDYVGKLQAFSHVILEEYGFYPIWFRNVNSHNGTKKKRKEKES